MSKVLLYGFGEALGVPDVSPFCVKMENYLRIAEIPFEKKQGNPREAPKGKLPYADINGQRYGDSTLIVQALEKAYNVQLNEGMSALEHAHARAYQSMLEEHFYFVLAYFRWQVDGGWVAYQSAIKKILQEAKLPRLLIPLILPSIRRGMIKTLAAQGTGRHKPDEVAAIGCSQLDALSAYLGERLFFGGDKPRTLDATTYAFLTSILVPVPNPLKDHLETDQRLMAYCGRMKDRLYAKA